MQLGYLALGITRSYFGASVVLHRLETIAFRVPTWIDDVDAITGGLSLL